MALPHRLKYRLRRKQNHGEKELALARRSEVSRGTQNAVHDLKPIDGIKWFSAGGHLLHAELISKTPLFLIMKRSTTA